MSITHLPCVFLKATMPCPCALTLYSLISVTMHIPCIHHEKPLFLDVTSNLRLFLILLDPKSFQTALDYSRPIISYHMTSQSCAFSLSCHRLIIILLQYLICPNPNPKVCPHFRLITIMLYKL